ncbi:MAG TPA: hypothetical protein VHR72_06450 [Gemmataceae bacterium]|jgi:hypothetical protein|nr:hypothetical protein [Gemmataceae bacterium]
MRSLKMLLALAAGPLALGLPPTHASAQIFLQQNPPGQVGPYVPPRVGYGGPAYSPYNNLNRPGGAANNYFGIVRPQMDAARAINQIQQQQAVGPGPAEEAYGYGTQQPFTRDPANQLTTGHAVTFANTAQYFPQQTGVRGVSGTSAYGTSASNRGFISNAPFAPYGVGGFGLGNAVVGGNVYNGVVNTPNASIFVGPTGPTVINRIP